MLNAIQHGVTIVNLQICRKGGQCGLRNIGDWGEGLNHVGKKLALVELLSRRVSGTKKGSTQIKVPAQKKMAGMNGQDPLPKQMLWAAALWEEVFFPEHVPHLAYDGQARAEGLTEGANFSRRYCFWA